LVSFGIKTPLIITFACLALAIICTVMAETRISPKGIRWAGMAMLALYGVCVGMVSSVLVYQFAVREWLAFVIALPLGFLVLGLYVILKR